MFGFPFTRLKRCSTHTLYLVLLMAVTGTGYGQEGEVKSKGGTVYYHGGKRPPANAWFSAGVNVQNPKSTPSSFKMKVTPMKQDNYAVNEISLPIPAESRMYIMQPITAGDTTAYAIDLIVDGRRTTNANSRETLTSQAQLHQNAIIVMKGDSDLRIGPITMDNPNLAQSYNTGFIDSRNSPQHWAGYDKAAALVVMDPDFASMNHRQYLAIKDYVLRGGTLIFIYPKSLFSLMGTPLEPILPVKPLRIRPIEWTDAFKQIGGSPMTWSKGADFAECVPVGDGVTTLVHEGFPAIRWRRVGLGYVGVCAFMPSHEDIMRNKNNYAVLFKHLLGYAGRGDYASSSRDLSLSRSVDKMTGIKIPKAGTIQIVVFGYIAVFFCLIAAGMILKRHSVSWSIVAIVSLTMIVGIFVASAVMRSNLPAKTGTLLAFTSYGQERVIREQLCGLLVKGEVNADMVSTNPDLLIRPMPSPWTPKRLQASKMKSGQLRVGGKRITRKRDKKKAQDTFQDPITFSMNDGFAGLLNITLRDGKPRFFNTQSMKKSQLELVPPVVNWTEGRPQMAAWTLPEGLTCDSAALIVEDGFFNVAVKGKTSLSIKSVSSDRLENPVINHLVEYMTRAGKSAPMLVMFSTATEDVEGFFQDSFKVMGYNVILIPVKDIIPAGKDVTIPAERIRTGGHFKNVQNLRIDGYWIMKDTATPSSPYLLQAILPPGYNQLDMKELRLNLDGSYGTNIEFDLFLVPGDNLKKKIKLTAEGDGVYTYNFTTGDKQAQAALDPANGIITLGIQPKQKQSIKDPVARLRLNAWRIKSLSVSVKGTCPNDQQGSL